MGNGFELFDWVFMVFNVLAVGSTQTERVCEINYLVGSPMEIATTVPKPKLGRQNRYSVHIVGLARSRGGSVRRRGGSGSRFAV
jgi:hypothetical protein